MSLSVNRVSSAGTLARAFRPAKADPIEPADPAVAPKGDEARTVEGERKVGSTAETPKLAAEGSTGGNEQELTAEEQQEVSRLKRRDAEVRTHEQAHAAAGGSHAGAPNLEMERGPDGKNYAVGGHVSIDTSEVSGDPEKTLAKMQTVQRAALAPAQPSSQDRKVAAAAASKAAKARQELAAEKSEAAAETGAAKTDAAGGPTNASGQGSEVPGAEQAGSASRSGLPARASAAYRASAPGGSPSAGEKLAIKACGDCGQGHG